MEAVGKTLICRKERGNIHDVYTVAVVEDDVTLATCLERYRRFAIYLSRKVAQFRAKSLEVIDTLVIYHRVALQWQIRKFTKRGSTMNINIML